MNREIIAQLVNEALTIRFKRYSAESHDWHDSTLYGYYGAKMVKKTMRTLDSGDIDTILLLIKEITKRIGVCEENDYVFYEELYQYQRVYDVARHNPVTYYTHKPAHLIESHQKTMARLKVISAQLKTELTIPTAQTQEEQGTENKNYIISLLMEAIYQVRMPALGNSRQANDFTQIRDLISFEQIEHAIEALHDGNLDPVLDLIRLIGQTISDHVENEPLFLQALEEYRAKYNPEFYIATTSPDEVARTHQESLARLKEIHALLQSAALAPSLQFLAVVGDNQADKSNPNPAHLFFKDGANHDLLKMVMQYAGFFKMRLAEQSSMDTPGINTSLQG
ncbi:hypothetical protein DIZ81_10775 [Legionella taurinensis]|uniref:Uncharacterized protein n=1 Tax=Legionella taurinensis TaxID=70611 RepID=A0A3A5LD88_9GAMM|nr:hypothetical protein [Legionella taurinensis]MDX1838331.1 hypothetical protein [Legionella taurinensis]PUT39096.1 hypothetical protein DB744_10785 [Legionella taurinensis]PUT39550.1 hypothetical protein DB746_13440 [Legionella taurinensis]PUT43552.1 hypothetical protein DB743_10175 [Legionella taurinensis]PUT45206.1 hypothetical protein DB745_13380 [Legionella taurinensis]